MTSFRTRRAVLAGALVCLAGSVTAQTNKPVPPGRQYDGRIQMHTIPTTLLVPENNLESLQGAPQSIDRNLLIPNDMPQESPIQPNGLRLKATLEKQQNKNWILPPSTEKKEEETTSHQRKETDPSGWGWLADDVRARRQKEKATEEQGKSDSDENDDVFQSPSVLKKESVESKTDNIFLDTTFKPVSASISTKEKEKAEDTSALDRNRNEQKSRQIGPTTAESSLNSASVGQPVEQKFGADAMWGNKSLWDKNSEAIGALPRTEALLSISKPNLTKQALGLDHPGFKMDGEEGAVARAELDRPETSRRNFDTAVGFQPVQSVPVRDLGNAPRVGDFSGNSPFGGSTSLTPAPSVGPSGPIESPKVPELPKPLAGLWLR